MLLSGFSLDIVLIVVIPIILVFYAILLVKLKPSKETGSPPNRYTERKREQPVEPKRIERPTTPAEPKKITNERPANPVKTQVSVNPQENPKKPATRVESEKIVPTQTHVETAETEEKQETKKDTEEKKSFFLFGERKFEGCSHKYGFLSSLPKNTPIPNECFGCSQIVECLRNLKPK